MFLWYPYSMNKEEIAQRLIEERERIRYNQAGVAALAGVSQGSWSSWEAGNVPQQWAALENLARHFGVSADYILGLTDVRERVEDAIEAMEALALLNETARQICQAVSELSPERVDTLLAVAQALLSDEHQEQSRKARNLMEFRQLLDMIKDVDGEKGVAWVEELLNRIERGDLTMREALRERR